MMTILQQVDMRVMANKETSGSHSALEPILPFMSIMLNGMIDINGRTGSKIFLFCKVIRPLFSFAHLDSMKRRASLHVNTGSNFTMQIGSLISCHEFVSMTPLISICWYKHLGNSSQLSKYAFLVGEAIMWSASPLITI